MKAEILKYRSLFRYDLYKIIDGQRVYSRIAPKEFVISKKEKPMIEGDLQLDVLDFDDDEYGSTLIPNGDCHYIADRWKPRQEKSLMLLHKVSKKEIELHFFNGFYLDSLADRVAFLVKYCYKNNIPFDEFKYKNDFEIRKKIKMKRKEKEKRKNRGKK